MSSKESKDPVAEIWERRGVRVGTAQQKLDVLKEELGNYSGREMGKILAEINLLEFVIKSLLRPEPTEAKDSKDSKDAKDPKDPKNPKNPKRKNSLVDNIRECNYYPFEYPRLMLNCSRVGGELNSNCGMSLHVKSRWLWKVSKICLV